MPNVLVKMDEARRVRFGCGLLIGFMLAVDLLAVITRADFTGGAAIGLLGTGPLTVGMMSRKAGRQPYILVPALFCGQFAYIILASIK